MSVEIRRVQRLGASSIVVTIPKEWARRMGIDVGSKVYLVDEGDSIRILPLEKDSGVPPEIPLPPIPGAAGSVVVCLYLSGLVEARLRPRGIPAREALMELKRWALTLLGLQVAEAEDGSLIVKVALDSDKLDVGHMLRGIAADARGILSILGRLLDGEPLDREELEVLEKDFQRNQHAIIRYLMSRQGGAPNLASSYYAALATGYLGFAVDILDDLLKMLPPEGPRMDSSEAAAIKSLLKGLEDVIDLQARILANPSFTRSGELLLAIRDLRQRIRESLSEARSPWAAVVLAKLHDVLRILNLATYVTLCRVFTEQVIRGKR